MFQSLTDSEAPKLNEQAHNEDGTCELQVINRPSSAANMQVICCCVVDSLQVIQI